MSDAQHRSEASAPACTKCRGHRAKCDRTRPMCNRCRRLGYACAYPVKNAATAFVNRVVELECEIAQLEQGLALQKSQQVQPNEQPKEQPKEQPNEHHHRQQPDERDSPAPAHPPVLAPVAGDAATAHGTSRLAGPMSSPTLSEYLITDLFANAEPLLGEPAVSKVKNLVDGLAQVSLSAMTAPGDDSGRAGPDAASHDLILHTLILSAVSSPRAPSDGSLPSLALPHVDIARRVCERYCADLLVEFPCLAVQDVQRHLRQAYGDGEPLGANAQADADRGCDGQHNRYYSMFVVATILATTAISLAPSSADKATALFLSGVQFLESVFVSDHQQKNPSDPLRDIETVVLLGSFGLHVGRAGRDDGDNGDNGDDGDDGNDGGDDDGSDRVDTWALSGIAVRIAVDLGLHKVCYSDRQQRLFWTAYILDRKCAVASRRPVGIPDAAIDCRPTAARGWDVLELYRVMSDAYTAALADAPASAGPVAAATMRFRHWTERYCAARQPSRHLAHDMGRVQALLSCHPSESM